MSHRQGHRTPTSLPRPRPQTGVSGGQQFRDGRVVTGNVSQATRNLLRRPDDPVGRAVTLDKVGVQTPSLATAAEQQGRSAFEKGVTGLLKRTNFANMDLDTFKRHASSIPGFTENNFNAVVESHGPDNVKAEFANRQAEAQFEKQGAINRQRLEKRGFVEGKDFEQDPITNNVRMLTPAEKQAAAQAEQFKGTKFSTLSEAQQKSIIALDAELLKKSFSGEEEAVKAAEDLKRLRFEFFQKPSPSQGIGVDPRNVQIPTTPTAPAAPTADNSILSFSPGDDNATGQDFFANRQEISPEQAVQRGLLTGAGTGEGQITQTGVRSTVPLTDPTTHNLTRITPTPNGATVRASDQARKGTIKSLESQLTFPNTPEPRKQYISNLIKDINDTPNTKQVAIKEIAARSQQAGVSPQVQQVLQRAVDMIAKAPIVIEVNSVEEGEAAPLPVGAVYIVNGRPFLNNEE